MHNFIFHPYCKIDIKKQVKREKFFPSEDQTKFGIEKVTPGGKLLSVFIEYLRFRKPTGVT